MTVRCDHGLALDAGPQVRLAHRLGRTSPKLSNKAVAKYYHYVSHIEK